MFKLGFVSEDAHFFLKGRAVLRSLVYLAMVIYGNCKGREGWRIEDHKENYYLLTIKSDFMFYLVSQVIILEECLKE